jgi:hypothetical protein
MTDPTPDESPRAQPDFEMMDDTAEWAQEHYLATHGRALGDEEPAP